MKSQLTVVGLGGSLAKHSSSLAALKIALQGAEETGAKTALPAGRGVSKVIRRVQDGTIPQFVEIPVKLIGARLRDVVDLRRSVTPQIDSIGKGVDQSDPPASIRESWRPGLRTPSNQIVG